MAAVEGERDRALPLVAGGAALVIYAVLAVVAGGGLLTQSFSPLYVYLARGWLHGSWWVVDQLPPQQMRDVTVFHGHLYVAFPPLPAVVLLPFVAIFGVHLWDTTISVAIGAINVVLFARCLQRLAGWGVRLTRAVRLWLCALFAFGSEVCYVTLSGSVWFFAHVVALSCLLLGIDETLRQQRRRPLVAALWFGLAGMARPDAWAGAAFFVVLECLRAVQAPCERQAALGAALRRGATLAAGMALFPLLGLVYNVARFGSPGDLGYQAMNVAPQLQPALQDYGQFSLHFLARDVYYMFLAPPLVSGAGIWVDPWGMSLFLVSPALFYLTGAWRVRQTRVVAWAALTAALLIALPLVTYYNTGWWQFGSRFSVDFLPFLLLLVALGVRRRVTWRLALLVGVSTAINVWGTLWFFLKLS